MSRVIGSLAALRPRVCSAFVLLSISPLLAHIALAEDRTLMKAEDVLAKWTERTGGDAWKKIQNRVMNGTFEIPLRHLKGPITTYAAAPRNKLEVWEPSPGQAHERGCDGVVAWESTAGSPAQMLAGKPKSVALLDAAFNEEVCWPDLYSKAETKAIRSVKRLGVGDQPETQRPCYEIEMTPRDPECNRELWYIDTENFQRIGSVGEVMGPTGKVKRMRLYADYRFVNDVLVPFLVCEQVDIQKQFIFYKSIQHNVRMSKYRFDLPESVKKQVSEGGKSSITSAPSTRPADAAKDPAPADPQPNPTPRSESD